VPSSFFIENGIAPPYAVVNTFSAEGQKNQLTTRSGDSFLCPHPNASPGQTIWSRLRTFLSWLWRQARRYLGNRYFAFLIFMVAFGELLGRMSELPALWPHLLTEAPILLALYWALNFVLRPGKLAPFVAAAPIVLAYTAYDLFFLAYGNVVRIIDFQNLPELVRVLPHAWKAGLLLALALPLVLVLGFVNYRRYCRILAIAGLAVVLVTTVELLPGVVLTGLNLAGLKLTMFSDVQSVDDNGRFTMVLYFEAKRRKALAEVARYRDRGDYAGEARAAADFIRKRGNHRNVHLVVLESWVDPTLLRAVTYSKDPRHPDFAKLVGDKQGFSISPVFGGGTAQAEFEALCGAPALHRFSSIEFDDFTGNAAACMPRILAQAGYSTMASNSFEPNYFNATKAYSGIGFQNIYFPVEYANVPATYLTIRDESEDEGYIFDGDLFDQNLGFVARTLREHPDRPLLNYVLGIYGHAPHDIDLNVRPLVLSVQSAHRDQQLLRAANQYWYRTQAIAHYVRALIQLDPKSLIVIVSDHLPPLDEGEKSYRDFRYLDNIEDSKHLNRILVVENGKVVRHNTIHHYDIPSLIYDYLTDQTFCAKNDCVLSSSEREAKYMFLMAHAVGLQ
jgi:phosphoglycerol transferase MdoB-like AlkP superfamily enzyme